MLPSHARLGLGILALLAVIGGAQVNMLEHMFMRIDSSDPLVHLAGDLDTLPCVMTPCRQHADQHSSSFRPQGGGPGRGSCL